MRQDAVFGIRHHQLIQLRLHRCNTVSGRFQVSWNQQTPQTLVIPSVKRPSAHTSSTSSSRSRRNRKSRLVLFLFTHQSTLAPLSFLKSRSTPCALLLAARGAVNMISCLRHIYQSKARTDFNIYFSCKLRPRSGPTFPPEAGFRFT